ncbi:GEVED domain-containing protein [Dyadobacter sp. 3J3]|uniref:GEVED domain-containing protein n=1 Tax=Dyadobacter sp. 3J3 TaxID=2606600 RepID=UPI00135A5456|nr:GEVED domain-containing protein [Dyadobacter sp. 3J3]
MKALYLTPARLVSIKILVYILTFAATISVSYAQGTGTIVISKKVEQDFSPGANIPFSSVGLSRFTLNDDPEFVSVQDLGMGNNNTMWVVAAPASGTGNGTVYYRPTDTSDWIETNGSGTRIDVTPTGRAFLIDQQGSQFFWTFGQGFDQEINNTPVNAVDVGTFAGTNQGVCYLSNNNAAGCNILVRRLGGGNFVYYPAICGTRLDVAQDGSAYVLDETAGKVYHVSFPGSGTSSDFIIEQTYNTSSLLFRDITVASDGSVWAVNATNCYRLVGGNWVLDPKSIGVGTGNNAAGISAGSDGDTPIVTYNAKNNVSNALRGKIFQRREDGTWMNDHAVRSVGVGNSIIFSPPAGTYKFTENLTAWELIAINTAGGSVAPIVEDNQVTVTIKAGETVHVEFVNEGRDYGDAPDSYGTQKASGGASHKVTNLLTLGSSVDPELDGAPGEAATGDNGATSDDENGISTFPAISGGANKAITNYTVNVSVKNATTATAKLCGWIDWNSNGTFEAGEGVCTTSGPGSIAATLVWPAATLGGSAGVTGVYARFRLTTGTLTTASAKGAVADGEVEDYFIAFVNPLPVKLMTFEGVIQEQNVTLSWVTTAETNADHFEIEHSLNGKIWNLAGTVAARGESNVQVNYSFEHKTPVNVENLYRLKMVDTDQTYAYSRIISIRSKDFSDLYAYPNPFTNELHFSGSDVTQIAVFDAGGTLRLKKDLNDKNEVDLKNLVPGKYLLKIQTADGQLHTQSVMKD